MFSEVLVYYITSGLVIAGADTTHADILLSGPDVLGYHCMLCAIKGYIYLLPYPEALVLVNGDIVHPPPPVASMAFADTSSSSSSTKSSSSNSNNNLNYDKRHHHKTNNNRASNSSSQESYVYYNTLATKDADIIKYGRILTHNDRIAFGRFHFFRFEDRDRGDTATSCVYTSAATHNANSSNNSRVKDSNSSSNNYGSSKVGLEVKRGWDYAQEEMLSKNSALMTSQNGHNYDLSPRSHTSASISSTKSSRTHHHNSSTPTTSATGVTPTANAANHIQSKRRPDDVTPNANYKSQQQLQQPTSTSTYTDTTDNRLVTSRKALSNKNGLVSDSREQHSNNINQDNTYTAYSSKPILSSLTIPPYHPPAQSTTQPPTVIPPQPLSDTLTNQRESHAPVPKAVTHTNHAPVPKSAMPEALNPKNSATPEAQFIFEKEAKELQIELTLMQQTLADRMAKYQILTKES